MNKNNIKVLLKALNSQRDVIVLFKSIPLSAIVNISTKEVLKC